MVNKILIHQDLIPKLSVLREFLGGTQTQIFVVTSGKDILQKVRTQSPIALVFPTTLKDLPIKILLEQFSQEGLETKVFIIHESEEELVEMPYEITWIPNKFDFQLQLGGQVLSLVEGDVPGFSSKMQEILARSQVQERKTPRVTARGSMIFRFEGKEFTCEVKNLSQGGVFFISPIHLGEGVDLQIKMNPPSGISFEVRSKVVRTQLIADEKYAVGAKFLYPTDELANQITKWINANKTLEHHGLGFDQKNASENKGDRFARAAERKKVSNDINFTIISHSSSEENLKEIYGENPHQGKVLDVSATGLMLATKTLFPNGTKLEIELETGIAKTKIKGVIVRSANLKKPIEEYVYGVGIKFEFASKEEIEGVEVWYRNIARNKSKNFSSIGLSLAEKCLSGDWENLKSTLLDEKSRLGKLFCIDLSGFELSTLQENPEYKAIVADAVLLKYKYDLFVGILPKLSSQEEGTGQTFLNYLGDLQEHSSSVEDQIEVWVKKSVKDENDLLKVCLNELSNRLFDSKYRCFEECSKKLLLQDWAKDSSVMKIIEEFLEKQKSFSQNLSDQVKYDQKIRSKEEETEEEKKEKEQRRSKMIKRVALVLFSFVCFASSVWIVRSIHSKVPVEELNLAIELIDSSSSGDGVVIVLAKSQWKAMNSKVQLEELKKIESYLIKEKFRQAKVLDEEGQILASMAFIQKIAGKPPEYRIRVHGETRFGR